MRLIIKILKDQFAVIIKRIKKYEKFTKKNLGIIRPGYGLDIQNIQIKF